VETFDKKVTITLQHCASVDDSTLTFITSTQENPPYTFLPLPGGSFSESGHGTIDVDHFSPFGLIARRKSYAFCTFYLPIEKPKTHEVHITVTPNLKIHLKLEKRYLEEYKPGRSIPCFAIKLEEISPRQRLVQKVLFAGVEETKKFLSIETPLSPTSSAPTTAPTATSTTTPTTVPTTTSTTTSTTAPAPPAPGQVVLPDLIKLSSSKRDIRILKESAGKYTQIGALLLRDDTGAIVSAIEQSDRVGTVESIYRQWIQEDEDHSWEKLIQCFRDVQLNSLARDLELHFGLTSPSDRGKVNVQGDTLPAVVHLRSLHALTHQLHHFKLQ
jgi:hypothetical protein